MFVSFYDETVGSDKSKINTNMQINHNIKTKGHVYRRPCKDAIFYLRADLRVEANGNDNSTRK